MYESDFRENIRAFVENVSADFNNGKADGKISRDGYFYRQGFCSYSFEAFMNKI
jgi:hypothetical protein